MYSALEAAPPVDVDWVPYWFLSCRPLVEHTFIPLALLVLRHGPSHFLPHVVCSNIRQCWQFQSAYVHSCCCAVSSNPPLLIFRKKKIDLSHHHCLPFFDSLHLFQSPRPIHTAVRSHTVDMADHPFTVLPDADCLATKQRCFFEPRAFPA